MATKVRSEFSVKVKRTVAERAAYRCCNPGCRKSTIAPHSDPTKSLNTGNAGHINAASEGGPRYDPDQGDEECKSIDNAIWLCSECHKKVDTDESAYIVDVLRAWKLSHEDWISQGGIVPGLPELELKTLSGYAVPDTPGTIKVVDFGDIKEQSLRLKNCSDTIISAIQARVQLPEPAIASKGQWPPGVNVNWKENRIEMRFTGGSGAGVTRGRPPLPTNLHILQVAELAPGQEIELRLFTSMQVWKDHDIDYTSGVWEGMNDPPNTMYYIDGMFQYQFQGATLAKEFFAPIAYDADDRQMSLVEVLPDFGDWKRVEGSFWS